MKKGFFGLKWNIYGFLCEEFFKLLLHQPTMKKYLFLLALFMFVYSVPFVYAQTQEITHHNETIQFRLEEHNACNGTNNLFRIERINYSQNTTPLQITYEQITIINQSNQSLHATNITKTINKFTKTNTGFIQKNSAGTVSVYIHIGNESLHWDLGIICILNTTLVAENTSVNNSVNTTNTSNTSPKENSSMQHNHTSCIHATIHTNNETFVVGERLEMQLQFTPRAPESYTYWITDLAQHTIKSKKTTTNTNVKTHTFTSFPDYEKLYRIYVAYDTTCKNSTQTKSILVLNPTYTPEEEKEEKRTTTPKTTSSSGTAAKTTTFEKNSVITILNAEYLHKYNQHFIELKLRVYRGNTQKSSISILPRINNTRVGIEQKVQLPKKYHEVIITLTIPLQEVVNETVDIIVEGLDVNANTKINIPQTQKQTINTTNTQEASPKKSLTSTQLVINSSPIPPIIYSEKQEKEKGQTALLGISLTVLLLGVFVGFGPKRVIDTFIKQ